MKPLFRSVLPLLLLAPISTVLMSQGTHTDVSEIAPEILKENELNTSGGFFYYLTKSTALRNECFFGTLDDSSDMGIRLNGSLHRLKLVSNSSKKKLKIGDDSPGDQWVETYSDHELKVRIEMTLDQIGKETMSFHGTMTITRGQTSKVLQVVGAGLG
ncbi:hypothetical protein [Geothrix rubra]|uniref:hypothetical protein n=1 Tax=Geothrix rubra TaxID=2927977 RepID=UPI002555855C|nr:hypothetical protein [Geothrix rubra]